jgi:hypothetical protein
MRGLDGGKLPLAIGALGDHLGRIVPSDPGSLAKLIGQGAVRGSQPSVLRTDVLDPCREAKGR